MTKKIRIYWRNQGSERRAYIDLRDLGGGRERARLIMEFPDSEVWVGLRVYRREIEYRVNGHTGSYPVHRFPDAIEEVVDFVRAKLR